MAIGYPPNLTKWKVDDLVLATSDAKKFEMLMVVVDPENLTEEQRKADLVAVRYLVPRRRWGSDRIYRGHFSGYYDPRIWLNMATANLRDIAIAPATDRSLVGLEDLDAIGAYNVESRTISAPWDRQLPAWSAIFDQLRADHGYKIRMGAHLIPGRDQQHFYQLQSIIGNGCTCQFYHQPEGCKFNAKTVSDAIAALVHERGLAPKQEDK